nr:DUF6056 family protein [uncultured Enterobacter sp.]
MFANAKKLLPWILVSVIIAYILQSIVFKYTGDDGYFSHALDSKGLFEFLLGRYNSWSGRVLIEMLLVCTINIPYVPYLIISLSLLLLSWSISHAVAPNNKSYGFGVLLALTLLSMNYHSFNQAVTWVTGAYNYLLPISLGIFSLSLKDDAIRKNSPVVFCMLCLCVFFACNNEQFGVCIILLLSLNMTRLIYKKNTSTLKNEIIFFLFAITGTAFVLVAPGNASRFAAEIPRWMPDFESYNLITKASFALDRINNHLLNDENFLYVACCALLIISTIKNKIKNTVELISVLICGIFLINFIFSTFPHRSGISIVFSNDYASPESWISWHLYASYFLSLLSFCCLIYNALCSDVEGRPCGFISIILIVGVLSLAMIGMSPTVYESGTRVAFLLDISLVFYAYSALKRLFI